MAPREEEECARSGHVTGQRSLHGTGSRKRLQRAPTNTMLFSDYHLAKLNPKCYMNYSIIFTEISFSPKTSISLHLRVSAFQKRYSIFTLFCHFLLGFWLKTDINHQLGGCWWTTDSHIFFINGNISLNWFQIMLSNTSPLHYNMTA